MALLTTAGVWGIAPPIIKYSLGFVSPLSFLFYRFLIVSLIFAIPLLIKLKKLKPGPRDCFLYLALGFIGTPLTLLFYFFGVEKTAAINASIISIFTPILIILGGVIFLNEKVTKKEKLGIALILLGASLGVIEPLFKTGVSLSGKMLGNILVLAGSITWATFSLLRRKYADSLDSFVLTASSFAAGLAVVSPLAARSSLFPVHPQAIPGILYMAIFGSVIAYFTYIYGFSKIEASEATLFTYLEPIFAIPVSIFFLKERTSFLFAVGALLILWGVIVSELRAKSQVKSKLKTAP